MTKFIFAPLILFAVLLSSCTSMLYTSIDVLRPAKVTFDKDASNLLILNNSVSQPESYGHTVELSGDKKKNVSVNTDSLAIFCLSVLNEEFQKNEFFHVTQLNLSSVNVGNSFLSAKMPLMDTLKFMSQLYNADVVLSLDKIKVNDRLADYYDNEGNYFYALLEANYETTWSVSYPKLNKSQSYTFKDTIYWDAESYQRKNALDALPNRYNALIDGALYVGQNMMKKLVPWWDKEDRYFFNINNKVVKQGLDSVYVKNWNAAIENWKNGLAKSNIPTQAKMLHNMAVAYEISGDMPKAIETIKKSLAVYETASVMDYNHYLTIYQYGESLEKRKKEVENINLQLGVK
jgi:hypothetical protein